MMSLQIPQVVQYNPTIIPISPLLSPLPYPYPYQFHSNSPLQSPNPTPEKSGKFNDFCPGSPQWGAESDSDSDISVHSQTQSFIRDTSQIVQNAQNFLQTIPTPNAFKFVSNQHISVSNLTQVSQPSQTKKPLRFEPKFNNHAKGNFYISKEKISEMVRTCAEPFITAHDTSDEKLAFGYFKESVAMQINDRQIRVVHTSLGDIILIHIDLHYYDGSVMYLIATENDSGFSHKVQWKIESFMSEERIYNTYGISTKDLPHSSRNTHAFKKGLSRAPVNVSKSVIYRTNFSALPGKKTKRDKERNTYSMTMSEADFKWYCEQSWDNGLIIPCVVIKGKRQWIEWKKFIDCGGEWVGISLRYYPSGQRWKIECMDYDAGRTFYQYRLVGCDIEMAHEELQQLITTSLHFHKGHRNGYYN